MDRQSGVLKTLLEHHRKTALHRSPKQLKQPGTCFTTEKPQKDKYI